MLPEDRLRQITDRFEFLEARLNAGPAADEIAAISREYSELKPVAEQIEAWHRLQAEIAEAEAMRADPEMRALAEEELPRLRAALPEAE
jgi:peptide chain release factor 1